jgi:hypothetical protein
MLFSRNRSSADAQLRELRNTLHAQRAENRQVAMQTYDQYLRPALDELIAVWERRWEDAWGGRIHECQISLSIDPGDSRTPPEVIISTEDDFVHADLPGWVRRYYGERYQVRSLRHANELSNGVQCRAMAIAVPMKPRE